MMSTHGSRILAAIAMPLAGLLSPSSAVAHVEVATIAGTVADSAGNPLAGARLLLAGDGIGPSWAITDARGRYRFPALSPHHVCSVTAERDGFRSIQYEGMVTEPGRTRRMDFRLKRPNERDIAALVTKDPFPYDEFLRGLAARAGSPVRVIDLDRERDPAETVRRIGAEKPDLIVAAGLRAARLVRREIRDIPSILTLITDARRHDLKTDTIGLLLNQPDADRLIERVSGVLPALRRVGMVYQADTSSLLVHDLREAAERRGVQVEFRLCRAIGDLLPALNSLRGRIDALIVPDDELTSIPRAREVITTWAIKNRLPLAAPTPEWAEQGALLSYGASYERLGEETSSLANRVLSGALLPGDIEALRAGDPELLVNRDTAKRLGIEIPSGARVDTIF
ncbi:MAG TPA: ABC transporter substrate binding protein [Candidatus Polarisedimenticolia bacterium]|nr:ABC transporter substrate binding protein [Candidatus Polarisedimenticolia bacterium]